MEAIKCNYTYTVIAFLTQCHTRSPLKSYPTHLQAFAKYSEKGIKTYNSDQI